MKSLPRLIVGYVRPFAGNPEERPKPVTCRAVMSAWHPAVLPVVRFIGMRSPSAL